MKLGQLLWEVLCLGLSVSICLGHLVCPFLAELTACGLLLLKCQDFMLVKIEKCHCGIVMLKVIFLDLACCLILTTPEGLRSPTLQKQELLFLEISVVICRQFLHITLSTKKPPSLTHACSCHFRSPRIPLLCTARPRCWISTRMHPSMNSLISG